MATKFDWMVVPDRQAVKTVNSGNGFDYDLVNMTISEALRYQKRDWGINLGWGDPATSSNIRFQRKAAAVGTPVAYGEMIAIGVKGGNWLRYQKRDHGINLAWSETPTYEWRFDPSDGAAKGNIPVMTLVGLYNSVEKDFVFYERRDWGINLKWFNDAGKFDTWSDLKDLYNKVKKAKEEIGEWIG